MQYHENISIVCILDHYHSLYSCRCELSYHYKLPRVVGQIIRLCISCICSRNYNQLETKVYAELAILMAHLESSNWRFYYLYGVYGVFSFSFLMVYRTWILQSICDNPDFFNFATIGWNWFLNFHLINLLFLSTTYSCTIHAFKYLFIGSTK